MNRLPFHQFDSTTNSTLGFDIPSTDTQTWNLTLTLDPLIDWLPKASQHKKYIPTWHLVRSYIGEKDNGLRL